MSGHRSEHRSVFPEEEEVGVGDLLTGDPAEVEFIEIDVSLVWTDSEVV